MARRKAAGACLLAALVMLFTTASAWAELGQRYALVIGNSTYDQVERLPNTATDAAAVADALEDLRFTVFRGIDLDREGFDQLIEEFRAASADAETVVLYYAGHGFQLRGRNHLVPVDAVLRDRAKIDAETLVLDDVIERIHNRGRQTIVFLDACRNNPLPPDVRDGTGDGLAQLQTGDGTFIAFATQPGNVSYDGNSKHSPFTEALLTYIGKPQQTIFELMINVRNEVSSRTLDRQVPWDQSSLRASFSFNPTPQAVARSGPPQLDDNRKQGIVISRAVPQAPESDTLDVQPSQTESRAEAAPKEPVTSGPVIRFGPPPRVNQQTASPSATPPEPAIGRQPVVEQEGEDSQDEPAVTASDPDTEPDTEQVGEAHEAEEKTAVTTDDEPSAIASDPQPNQGGAPGAADDTTAAAATDQPAASRSAVDDEQAEPREEDKRVAALQPADDAGAREPSAPVAEAQDVDQGEQKLAALPQEQVEPEPQPDAPLIEGEELVRLIQQNLQRLGCYRLGIDGDWGPGSRSGLERFYSESGEAADSLDPSPDVLARLEQESGEICPPPKVKSPPKKSRVAAPAPKAPAPSTPQRAPQRQSAPQAAPAQKAPPKIIGF